MKPILIALRDAVAARINEIGVFEGASAKGVILPLLDGAEVPSDVVSCEVLVENATTEQLTPSEASASVVIQVVVQRRITGDAEEVVPDLITACETAWNDLQCNEIVLDEQGATAFAPRANNNPVYDKLELNENNIFAAMVTLTFEVQ